MDALADRLLNDALAIPPLRGLLDGALQSFYAFVLVLIRMSGLMTIGPLFGQAVVPTNVRILLVLTMTFVITPVLTTQSRIGFDRLDANADGVLTRDEIPDPLLRRYEGLLVRHGKPTDGAIEWHEFSARLPMPRSVIDLAVTAIGELALGLMLGLGLMTILSGLQLAGDQIDQQTGLALGEIANPGLESSGSITGQFLFLLGVTVLLVLEPLGGHLLMVSALIETFQTLPVGDVFLTTSAIDLLRDLVHQSLVLGIQAAAPILAVLSLVALAMGFLGHSVPQINVLVIGFPVRAMINLAILALPLTGVSRIVVDQVPEVIDALRYSLTGLQ